MSAEKRDYTKLHIEQLCYFTENVFMDYFIWHRERYISYKIRTKQRDSSSKSNMHGTYLNRIHVWHNGANLVINFCTESKGSVFPTIEMQYLVPKEALIVLRIRFYPFLHVFSDSTSFCDQTIGAKFAILKSLLLSRQQESNQSNIVQPRSRAQWFG